MPQDLLKSDTDEQAGAVLEPPRFTLARSLTAGIIGTVGAVIIFVGVAFIYERLFDEEGQIVRFIWFSAFGFGLLGMEHLSNESWPLISAAGVAGLMVLRIFG